MTFSLIHLREYCPAGLRFTGACKDTHKAWSSGNMLSLVNPKVLKHSKACLQEGDEVSIVDLMLDIMGPVAPVQVRDAMSLATKSHKEVTKIVCTLAVRSLLKHRASGSALDMEHLRIALLNWISVGHFGFSPGDPGFNDANSATKIAELVSEKAIDPAAVRLAIVAPLAPVIESLILICRLSAPLIENLDHAYERNAGARNSLSGQDSLLSRVLKNQTSQTIKAPASV